jgi:uncharacterized protein YgiM (DUF1202 family)
MVISMCLLSLCGLIIVLMLGASALSKATAQTEPALSACGRTLEALWMGATNACINKPDGYLCNGGAPPAVEPAGAVANAIAPVGSLVEVGAVDALRAPPYDASGIGGILWLRRGAPSPISLLLIGDVTLRDASTPDVPPWSALMLYTAPEASVCIDAPRSVLIAQSPLNQQARIAINGVSLLLGVNSTALVRTAPGETIFTALSGIAGLIVLGEQMTLWAGTSISVPHAPDNYSAPIGRAGAAVPFDPAYVERLPAALFDRPIILPQPGTVTTLGAVNLRTEPNTASSVIAQVQAGEMLAVLGSSTDGAWLHVRRQTGETGWMFAELLGRNLGAINARYFLTPLPPQRLGEMGRTARVLGSGSLVVRSGPDALFAPLGTLAGGSTVTLLTRSPYSPWVKVDVGGGVTGWVALVGLETQAFIDALPVEINVPMPPTITPLPGSFGNAFPDPNRPGN